MNKRRLFSVIALTLALTVFSAACSKESGKAADDEKVKITFGSTEQANMSPGMAAKWAVDEILEQTEGRIEISYHPQGTLGTDADLTQQVLSGNIPMAGVSIGALSQYTPLLETVQLPFLLSSYDEEKAAFESEEFKALVTKVEEEYNIKILSFVENGMRHFATIDKPLNKIEDVKGVKLRVAPSVIIQEAMKLIGANPMSITYGEVSTALQNGTIDGEEINITSAGSQKHYEVIKYISEVGFYPYPSVFIMNGSYYNSLSEEDQKIIVDTFAEAQVKSLTEYIDLTEETFRKECEDNGVVFNKVEDIKPFKDAVQGLYDEYSAKDPLIKAFIEKYND